MSHEQKYEKFTYHSICGLLGESGGESYLASQCPGLSGLEKDLKAGWLVIGHWSDGKTVVFLLERGKSKNPDPGA